MRHLLLPVLCFAALGLAPFAANAQRPAARPAGAPASDSRVTLRCTKQRDHALVYNGGPGTVPTGAVIEVHATGATQEAEGTGNGTLDHPLAPQQSWLHPIRFSANFTDCAARVVSQP